MANRHTTLAASENIRAEQRGKLREAGGIEQTCHGGDGNAQIDAIIAAVPEPGAAIAFGAAGFAFGGQVTEESLERRPDASVT